MTKRQRTSSSLMNEAVAARGAALRLGAQVEEAAAHVGQFQRGGNVGVHLLHDGVRRAGRRHESEPRDGDEIGQAEFGCGRHVGRHRAARAAGQAQKLRLPGLLEAQRGGDVADEDVDPAGGEIDQRRPLALVGDVDDLDAGHGGEHLRRQVRGRAVALRGIGHLAGIGLGVGDQLLEAAGGQVETGGDDIGHDRQHRDRHELRPVIGQRLVEIVVDRQGRGRTAQQRVAVRLGAIGDLGADIAGRAGAIVDDDRLAPGGRKLLADDAAEHVGRSAGREGHDDADLLVGIGCLGKARRRQQHQRNGRTPHTQHSLFLPGRVLVLPAMLAHLTVDRHALAAVSRFRPVDPAANAAARRHYRGLAPARNRVRAAPVGPGQLAANSDDARPRIGDPTGRGAAGQDAGGRRRRADPRICA